MHLYFEAALSCDLRKSGLHRSGTAVKCVATISSQVRSFGLLTVIAVALTQFKASLALKRYIERLEQKQAKVRVIQQATRIVMDSRGRSEEEANQLRRSQAMLRREQIETVAGDIVKALEIQSF